MLSKPLESLLSESAKIRCSAQSRSSYTSARPSNARSEISAAVSIRERLSPLSRTMRAWCSMLAAVATSAARVAR